MEKITLDLRFQKWIKFKDTVMRGKVTLNRKLPKQNMRSKD